MADSFLVLVTDLERAEPPRRGRWWRGAGRLAKPKGGVKVLAMGPMWGAAESSPLACQV